MDRLMRVMNRFIIYGCDDSVSRGVWIVIYKFKFFFVCGGVFVLCFIWCCSVLLIRDLS